MFCSKNLGEVVAANLRDPPPLGVFDTCPKGEEERIRKRKSDQYYYLNQ